MYLRLEWMDWELGPVDSGDENGHRENKLEAQLKICLFLVGVATVCDVVGVVVL